LRFLLFNAAMLSDPKQLLLILFALRHDLLTTWPALLIDLKLGLIDAHVRIDQVRVVLVTNVGKISKFVVNDDPLMCHLEDASFHCVHS